MSLVACACFMTLGPFAAFLAVYGPEGPGRDEMQPGPDQSADQPADQPAEQDFPVLLLEKEERQENPRGRKILGFSLLVAAAAVMVTRVALIATKPVPDTQCAADTEEVVLSLGRQELTGAGTEYRCVIFDFRERSDCRQYVTKINHDVNNPVVVHHMQVFALPKDSYSDCTFTCFDMPDITGMPWAWAVGQEDFVFPPGTGMEIGGATRAAVMVLQIHYDNMAMEP